MVVTVPEVPSRCRPVGAAVLGGEAIDVDRDLRDHRLERLAAHRRRRRGARPASRRRSASRSRPRSRDAAGRAASASSGRAERARRSRRRCRTGSRPRPPDRPAACSRWRRAAPRSRDRRSRARCRPRCGCARRKSRPLPAERQASVAIRRERVTPRLRILARQTRSASTARRIAASLSTAGAGDAFAEPDDARERIDHPEAVAGGARHQQPAVVGAEIERSIGRAGQIQPALPAAAVLTALARMPIGRPPAPPGPLDCSLGSRSGTGPRPVARASSSIVKPFPTPKPSSQRSTARR